jgi:hypothetical protein
MRNDVEKSLEDLWDRLLSRDHQQIHAAFDSLTLSERNAVLAHLKRMAEETGWQADQRASALAALQVLQDLPAQDS